MNWHSRPTGGAIYFAPLVTILLLVGILLPTVVQADGGGYRPIRQLLRTGV